MPFISFSYPIVLRNDVLKVWKDQNVLEQLLEKSSKVNPLCAQIHTG